MSSSAGPSSEPKPARETFPADGECCCCSSRGTAQAGRDRRRKASSSHPGDGPGDMDLQARQKRTSSSHSRLALLGPHHGDLASAHPEPEQRTSPFGIQSSSLPEGDDDTAGLDREMTQAGGGNKPFSFFTFPAEIRNMIYGHSLHYPDCTDLYRTYYRRLLAQPATGSQSTPYQRAFRTPTLLLLCRRITAECLPVLRARPLIIDRLPPFRVGAGSADAGAGAGAGADGLMRISDFVGRRTLQSVRHLDVRIGLGEGPLGSGWIWQAVLDEVLEILLERNAFARLRLLIRACWKKEHPSVWLAEAACSTAIFEKMRAFVDDNPNVFARREVAVEVWRVIGHEATFVKETVWPQPEDKRRRIPPPVRTYPDREMFPGSIMQFVEPLPPPFYPQQGEEGGQEEEEEGEGGHGDGDGDGDGDGGGDGEGDGEEE